MTDKIFTIKVSNDNLLTIVRFVLEDDVPWFFARDIAVSVGYTQYSSLATVLDYNVSDRDLFRQEAMESLGGRKIWLVNLDGVTQWLIKARKPAAVKFLGALNEAVINAHLGIDNKKATAPQADRANEPVGGDKFLSVKLLEELLAANERLVSAVKYYLAKHSAEEVR